EQTDRAGGWREWERLLKTKIGISTGRASELMQIADGRKTTEQIRAETNKRKIEHRKASSFRNEESADPPEALAEAMKAKLAAADDDARPQVEQGTRLCRRADHQGVDAGDERADSNRRQAGQAPAHALLGSRA